jgi:hypothetical protein
MIELLELLIEIDQFITTYLDVKRVENFSNTNKVQDRPTTVLTQVLEHRSMFLVDASNEVRLQSILK